MALYLVQHGRSLPRDRDPDPGLTVDGISDVERIAGVAKGYGVRVGAIRHSGKTRARHTAEIFAAALGPVEGIQVASGLNPLDEVAPWASQVRSEENVMLVGHLPFMERLVSYLVTGSAERLVFKFQNGGIVCLDKDTDTPFWYLKWTLMPHIG
jgi:phosphohistidine phosphatase